jgi:CRISPR-associated endoribonuclease Cas6
MMLRLNLVADRNSLIPINYNYNLSAAIYRIIAKGDADFAELLHKRGYGKGFKFFTFSLIDAPFKVLGDRLKLVGNHASVLVSFHVPEAMENFIKGLFQSEQLVIEDYKSKSSFFVESISIEKNLLESYKDDERIEVELNPKSPIVAGLQNDLGNYIFLSPDDDRYVNSLIYNWTNKIKTIEQNEQVSQLSMKLISTNRPFKSKLITIKANTPQETKIRGWLNFKLIVKAEKRYVNLLQNTGVGIYNSMGMGCVQIKVNI